MTVTVEMPRLPANGKHELPPDGVRIDAIGITKTIRDGQTTLLRDISLTIQPRELVAIVGASGAGKSTLMNALTGFNPADEGRVLINGADAGTGGKRGRALLGYVPQDDLVHGPLTVAQGLAYSARLRLPGGTSEEEIARRVDDVLDEIELRDRRDLPVEKLSGGQRKRVSIGVELISRPRVLFLDEPTSGLDPGLDLRLMRLLRRLADEGRTVVLTTHAVANLGVCDKVIFLGRGGRLSFYGSPDEALAFFGAATFPEIYAMLEHDSSAAETWERRYRESHFHARHVAAPLAPLATANPAQDGASTTDVVDDATPTSAWRQFITLTRRYVRLLWSDKPTLVYSLAQAPMMGLFLGLVAGSDIFADGKPFSAAQVALTLLMVFNLWIGANTASREVVKENAIYRRERLVNLKVPPYILSKTLVLAAVTILQTIGYVVVFLLMTGAPSDGVFLPAWLELMFTVWLIGVAGSAMGLFISAAAANFDLALSITPSAIIPHMLLAGALFALPSSVDFLSHATIGKWGVNALGTTADLNRMYYAAADRLPNDDRVAALLGQVVFNPDSYDSAPGPKSVAAAKESRRAPLLTNWSALLGWIVLFTSLACVAQWRKDRRWGAD